MFLFFIRLSSSSSRTSIFTCFILFTYSASPLLHFSSIKFSQSLTFYFPRLTHLGVATATASNSPSSSSSSFLTLFTLFDIQIIRSLSTATATANYLSTICLFYSLAFSVERLTERSDTTMQKALTTSLFFYKHTHTLSTCLKTPPSTLSYF